MSWLRSTPRSAAARLTTARLPMAAAALLAALTGGCGYAAAASLPPAPPMATVSMREYRFDFAAASLHRGRVIFHVVNDGRLVHRMILAPLPDDFPPIQEQLHGDVRRSIQQALEIRNLEPAAKGAGHGMSEDIAFDLRPGRYAFLCLYVDPDGVSHATKGMASEFRVP